MYGSNKNVIKVNKVYYFDLFLESRAKLFMEKLEFLLCESWHLKLGENKINGKPEFYLKSRGGGSY